MSLQKGRNFVVIKKQCYNVSTLRLIGESLEGYKSRNLLSTILGGTPGRGRNLAISNPQNFRQVSAIIDVDILPETCRRVRLLKHGSDRPLGFYIRDGTTIKVTSTGESFMSYVFYIMGIRLTKKIMTFIACECESFQIVSKICTTITVGRLSHCPLPPTYNSHAKRSLLGLKVKYRRCQT